MLCQVFLTALLRQTPSLPLPPAGVALVGHQVRRAVVLDPATRLPRLEESDGPLDAFMRDVAGEGLQLRVLSRRATCSNVDSDPMVLLAVGGQAAVLAGLPGA